MSIAGSGDVPDSRSVSRRRFLKNAATTGLVAGLAPWRRILEARENRMTGNAPERPNVVLVITDDQGYGDLGYHGNPLLKTPNLDRLFAKGVELSDFHVSPVCTPTRSAILTGNDPGRVGIRSTAGVCALMRAGVPTAANVFAENGYRTGLFGKWHLGDNYPFRPQDRGFQETLCYGGWEPDCVQNRPWMVDGWDDIYKRNGKPEQATGYIGDVWFDEAIKWMKQCQAQDESFFTCIPTNEAHWPWIWLGEEWWGPYKDETDQMTAKFYGTIAHIDERMGVLEGFLQESGLAEDTILIFLGDNGTARGDEYYNAELRGKKASLYEGGHRTPCFIRWPRGGIAGGEKIEDVTSQVDVLPTLIELCGLRKPDNAAFDGVSLAPRLQGRQDTLPERVVMSGLYWGDDPGKYNHEAILGPWRLVAGNQLFDMRNDWSQQTNVAAEHPEIVARLRAALEERWDSIQPNLFDLSRIIIGSDAENPMELTGFDWADGKPIINQGTVLKGPKQNGHWELTVARDGKYEFCLSRWPKELDVPLAGVPEGKGNPKALPITGARLKIAGTELSQAASPKDSSASFTVSLKKGDTRLKTWFHDEDGNELCGAYYVVVQRL